MSTSITNGRAIVRDSSETTFEKINKTIDYGATSKRRINGQYPQQLNSLYYSTHDGKSLDDYNNQFSMRKSAIDDIMSSHSRK